LDEAYAVTINLGAVDMRKGKSKPKAAIDNAILASSFLDLSQQQKNLLNSLYLELLPAFTLNPHAIKYFQGQTDNYFIVIDVRLNSVYIRVKEFLNNNRDKISSYCCIGDADFIVEISATKPVYKNLEKQLFDLLDRTPIAPRDGEEKLIQSFSLPETHILKSKEVGIKRDRYDLSSKEKQLMTKIQGSYASDNALDMFGGSKQRRKDFLNKLHTQGILLGYTYLGIRKDTVKAYMLLQYTRPGYVEFILRTPEIVNKIVDFHSLKAECVDDKFYAQSNFLITGEFSNIDEYHKWKETLYYTSYKEEQQINIMTFIVENVISEHPRGIGNYALFEEIVQRYSKNCDNGILVGHPFYLNEEQKQSEICLNLSMLKEHGFIIGEPGTGKTYTAVSLINKISARGINVHIIDCSKGVRVKFAEVYPDFSPQKIIQIDTEQQPSAAPLVEQGNGEIFVYEPSSTVYCDFVKKVFQFIIALEVKDNTRVTKDVIFFEEAHLFLRDEEANKEAINCITIAGRKGYSLWFLTQKLSHFGSKMLVSNIRNRVAHSVDSEAQLDVAALLVGDSSDSVIDDLPHELVNLGKGEAIVSFMRPQEGRDLALMPIKIKVKA